MGKKDVSTETKLDPIAEKARNIGYNANLAGLGYGSLSDYGKGGEAKDGSMGPTYPAIPPSGGTPMPGQVGTNPGVTQYSGPMINARAPGGQPNGMLQLGGAQMNASGAPQPNYQQDYVGPGSSVAGYDQGFGDAYGGTGQQADANRVASQGGYDAAGRFLDPNQANADAATRMSGYNTAVSDPLRAKYEESLALAQRAAGQSALSSGAFGGSRSAVAAGEAGRGATLDYNAAEAQRQEQAYYAARGETAAAGQLGANLGMGAGQAATDAYRNQGAFSEQARQLQQDKYDAKFKDLGMLTDALNGGTSGTTVVERGGGGFFG